MEPGQNDIGINSGYLVFFDILGFRELVSGNKLQDVVDVYRRTISNCLQSTEPIFAELKKIDPEGRVNIRSTIVSDSIVFWTQRDGPDSFIKLLLLSRAFLTASFIQGIPLRGAFEYGEIASIEFPRDDNWGLSPTPVILGSAFTRAYELEKKQVWAGCVVSGQVMNMISSKLSQGGFSYQDLFSRRKLLVNYPVLIRESRETSRQHLNAVNWPSLFELGNLNPQLILDGFSSYSKNSTSEEVLLKMKETMKFYDFITKV